MENKSSILKIFFVIILLVNIVGVVLSLPWYPRDFVGADTVEVYEVSHTSNVPFVSVKKWTSDYKLEDTGKKVEVSIRSSYRDEGMGWIPKVTILLLVIYFALYRLPATEK